MQILWRRAASPYPTQYNIIIIIFTIIIIIIIKTTFHGFLQFEYSCSHCSTDTNSIEPYLDWVIDPCGNVEGSLVRSMDEHVTKACRVCNTNASHSLCKTIHEQPTISIIHINRFKTVNQHYHKNTSKLVYTEIISNSTFKGQL